MGLQECGQTKRKVGPTKIACADRSVTRISPINVGRHVNRLTTSGDADSPDAQGKMHTNSTKETVSLALAHSGAFG